MWVNKSTYPYDIQYQVSIRIFVISNKKISIYFICFGKRTKQKEKEETKKLEKETAQNVLMLAISIRENTYIYYRNIGCMGVVARHYLEEAANPWVHRHWIFFASAEEREGISCMSSFGN